MSPHAQKIVAIVQQAAHAHHAFERQGPGAGNRVTNAVMAEANRLVAEKFGDGVAEVTLVDGIAQSIDFYLTETSEAIEVELSLSNPYPCLEKDAFKLLLAKNSGRSVKRLVLVGDPGSSRRMSAPAPTAIIDYLRRQHALEVEICELLP